MAVTLTYGNKPPGRNEAGLGAQVRADTQLDMIRLQNEMWAFSGESLGGITYLGPPWRTAGFAEQNSSATFFGLQNFTPLVLVEQEDAVSEAELFVAAYTRNLEVEIEVYDENYSYVTAGITSASAAAAWHNVSIPLPSTPGNYIVVVYGSVDSHDTTGDLFHLGAKIRPTSAAKIP